MPTTQPDVVNAYVPTYLADGAVRATGYGFSEPVSSTPYCLSITSGGVLVQILGSYGVAAFWFFAAPWKDTGFTFNQQVPWISLPSGAIVNAGILAEYFNHGVHPFVGSSYEAGLLADVNYRIQQAQQGNISI